MTPSLAIPTDNIYKFTFLFGLALIISAVFSFTAVYTSSLDKKIKYSQILNTLEAKKERSPTEEGELTINKRLLEVTRLNEDNVQTMIGALIAVGILLSVFGGVMWYEKIQKREDQFAVLQLKKLELEVETLKGSLSSKNEDKKTA